MCSEDLHQKRKNLEMDRKFRAHRIANAGSFTEARASGALPDYLDLTLSEALILGLLNQGVKDYIVVLGHGSTEIGEVLRIYQHQGVLKVYQVRSELEASHAAVALRWVRNQKAAGCRWREVAAFPYAGTGAWGGVLFRDSEIGVSDEPAEGVF